MRNIEQQSNYNIRKSNRRRKVGPQKKPKLRENAGLILEENLSSDSYAFPPEIVNWINEQNNFTCQHCQVTLFDLAESLSEACGSCQTSKMKNEEKAMHLCSCCHVPQTHVLTVHHRISRSYAKTYKIKVEIITHPTNALLLCRDCHDIEEQRLSSLSPEELVEEMNAVLYEIENSDIDVVEIYREAQALPNLAHQHNGRSRQGVVNWVRPTLR